MVNAVPELRQLPIAERLAAFAVLYRDPKVVVAQSHGQDLANLVGVHVFARGLAAWARGSLRGRLMAIGALGYLSTATWPTPSSSSSIGARSFRTTSGIGAIIPP